MPTDAWISGATLCMVFVQMIMKVDPGPLEAPRGLRQQGGAFVPRSGRLKLLDFMEVDAEQDAPSRNAARPASP